MTVARWGCDQGVSLVDLMEISKVDNLAYKLVLLRVVRTAFEWAVEKGVYI